MSITHYKQLTRILNTAMCFLTVFPVFLLVLCYLGALSLSWTLLFPAAAFLFSFLIRQYCSGLPAFTLCNLFYFLMPFVVWQSSAGLSAHFPGTAAHVVESSVGLPDLTSPRILLTVFYTVFAVGMVVGNFVAKLRREKSYLGDNMPVALLAIPILSQIASLSLNISWVAPWILICAVFQILFYFLNSYLIRYIAFLEEVKSSAAVPIGQINSSNSWLLVIFFLLSGLLVAVACFLPLERILPAVWSVSVDAFRALFLLILWLFSQKSEESGEVSDSGSLSPEQIHADFGTDGQSPFWEMVGRIAFIVVAVAAVIAILVLVIYLILLLVKAFYSQKTLSSDRVEFLNPFEKKETLSSEPQPESSFWSRLFGASPEQRIRKAWYRMIRTRIREVPVQMSPVELSHDASRTEEERHTAQELSNLYEKARYSSQTCTKEDVEAAKQLAGKLKSK